MERIDNICIFVINEIERDFNVSVIARVGYSNAYFTISYPNNERLTLVISVKDILRGDVLHLIAKLGSEIKTFWYDKIRRS